MQPAWAKRRGIDLEDDAVVVIPDLEIVYRLGGGSHETGKRLLGFGERVELPKLVARGPIEQDVPAFTHARYTYRLGRTVIDYAAGAGRRVPGSVAIRTPFS